MQVLFGQISMKRSMSSLATACAIAALPLALFTASHAFAQTPPPAAPAVAPVDETFDVREYRVVGNTLIPNDVIASMLRPFSGPRRVYGDIQKALEALEAEYRRRGFAAVQVFVPEQTLDTGVVRLEVIEAKLKNVKVEGHAFFDVPNIRAALPSLKEGRVPNARDIAANVRVANENPMRQVDVVLSAGNKEDEVDATVQVKDSRPLRITATLDNTGNPQTGEHRISTAIQHGNLFNRDHVGTFQYTTSVQKPNLVDIFSVGYRVPLYRFDGSIDMFYAESTVSNGTTTTVAGPLSFTGQGEIFGLRFNQYLQRRGEFTHRLIYGFDWKKFENRCQLGTLGAAGCGPAALPITVHPVSLTYAGELSGIGRQSTFSATLSKNWAGFENGFDQNFNQVRPATGGVGAGGGAVANYTTLRGNFSHTHALPKDFQLRAALGFQYADKALVAQEQFGVAGAQTVRGFQEREFARDRGHFINLELYSPDLGDMVLPGSNLRLLAFYDMGRARNKQLAGDNPQTVDIASFGFGVRFSVGRYVTLRADYAEVERARALSAPGVSTSSQVRGNARGHFSLIVSY
jgi:hemolysin activation/secretion protein